MLEIENGCENFMRKYLNKWHKCSRCDLCNHTKSRPIARGFAPFEVLFVGEAPGESEDLMGIPFVGPSGRLMNHIIERSLNKISYLLINSVVCTPPRENGKIREPLKEELESCIGHVTELITKFSPKLIIAVGQHANKSLKFIKHETIIHPAALLRYPERKMDIAVNQCVFSIQKMIRELEIQHVQ